MDGASSLFILVAGPYRSGTNDDPQKIAANVKQMNNTALQLYRMGTPAGAGRMVRAAPDRSSRPA